jgi:hypothetical protein
MGLVLRAALALIVVANAGCSETPPPSSTGGGGAGIDLLNARLIDAY